MRKYLSIWFSFLLFRLMAVGEFSVLELDGRRRVGCNCWVDMGEGIVEWKWVDTDSSATRSFPIASLVEKSSVVFNRARLAKLIECCESISNILQTLLAGAANGPSGAEIKRNNFPTHSILTLDTFQLIPSLCFPLPTL